MNEPIYKIAKSNFDFKTVGIIGIVTEDGEFCWAMDLYAETGSYDGLQATPQFSFTELEPTKRYQYNQNFIWRKTSAYNKKKDCWVGSFYIFDSQFFKCRVELNRTAEQKFRVKVIGKVNMNWETAKTKKFVAFHIENEVPFNGVFCEIESEVEARKIAGKYLDVSQMQWNPRDLEDSESKTWLRC